MTKYRVNPYVVYLPSKSSWEMEAIYPGVKGISFEKIREILS